jgi:hypothetical protein
MILFLLAEEQLYELKKRGCYKQGQSEDENSESFFFYSYVHTRLGSFLPPAPTPSLTTHSAPSLFPPPPQYPAETILPLFLILL